MASPTTDSAQSRALVAIRRVATLVTALLLCAGAAHRAAAQAPGTLVMPPDQPVTDDTTAGARLQVFLLTMGQGDAVWEKFGHNALWIRDRSSGLDVAYNWGLFDFNEADFIPRFLEGSMRYSMAGFPAEPMIAFYARTDRSVWAQELELTPAQKLELLRFVEWNALEENRFYHYDYFLDNCSTRVRDALDRVLGGRIRAATDTVPTGTSYRWHTRRLTQEELPVYTGMDLVLGEPGDQEISAWAEMFLPMKLRERMAGITVPGPDGVERPLVRSEVEVYTARRAPEASAPANYLAWYVVAGLALAAVVVALSLASDRGGRAPRAALATVGSIWSLLGGVLGVVMVLTWTVTDHTFMYRNENLLQFTPISLALVVMLPRLFVGGVAPRATRVVAGAVAALSVLGFVLQALPAFYQSNGEIIALALPVHVALAWAAWRAAA